MRAPLTDRYIQSLKPSQHLHWDLYLPCFGVWQGKYRTSFVILKNNKRQTIGHYPEYTLASARSMARKLLLSDTSPLTLAELVDEYIERHLIPNTRPATAKETERILRKYFYLDLPINTLSIRTITPILQGLAATPPTANQATAQIKGVLNYAVAQQHLDLNPLQGLKKPYRDTIRDRVLSDSEVKDLIDATDSHDPFHMIVRLLLMTGQRRQQIGKLRWDQIHATQIVWDRAEMKRHASHVIPITPAMQTHLDTQRKTSAYVFGTSTNWYHSTEALRAKLPHFKPWSLHDLRRTASTNLHRLGTLPHIVEHILHHAPPKISRTYNRHNFFQETKQALLKYHDWLGSL